MTSARRRTRVRRGVLALLALTLVGTYVVVETRPDARSAAADTSTGAATVGATGDAPVVRPMPAVKAGRLLAAPAALPAAPAAVPAAAVGQASAAQARVAPAATTGLNVTSVSQGTDKLDVFGIDAGQRIYHASWRPDDANGWNRSAQLNGGIAAAGTSVYAVSRFNGRLDAFAVGSDFKVYTAFKDTGVGRGEWRGWWQIPGLTVRENTSVTAVRVDRNNIMILAVGADLVVYANTWTAALPDVWQGWHAVSGLTSAGYTVFGAVVSDGVVDIYANGRSGRSLLPHSNRWDGGWQGWRSIKDSSDNDIPLYGSLYPVRYGSNEIALFGLDYLTRDNKNVFPISVNSFTIDRQAWGNWEHVRGGESYSVWAPITAVSRRPGHLDVFHVGRDKHIYSAAFTPGEGWQGWWEVGDDVLTGTGVFAQSRSTDHIDLFAISPNTGTYTRGWDPTNGWGCWCEVGPHGQAGDAIEYVHNIDFNGGTNVDGWVRLIISSSGAWSYRGHFNSAGPLTYNVGHTGLIALPNGRGFTFQAKGKAEGVVDGGSDYNFERAGVDPDIAANWSQIRTSGEWSSRARTSLDVGRLLSDLLVAAAYTIRIVDTVSAA